MSKCVLAHVFRARAEYPEAHSLFSYRSLDLAPRSAHSSSRQKDGGRMRGETRGSRVRERARGGEKERVREEERKIYMGKRRFKLPTKSNFKLSSLRVSNLFNKFPPAAEKAMVLALPRRRARAVGRAFDSTKRKPTTSG